MCRNKLSSHAVKRYIERIDSNCDKNTAEKIILSFLQDRKKRKVKAFVEGNDGFTYEQWFLKGHSNNKRWWISTNPSGTMAITILTHEMFMDLKNRVGQSPMKKGNYNEQA